MNLAMDAAAMVSDFPVIDLWIERSNKRIIKTRFYSATYGSSTENVGGWGSGTCFEYMCGIGISTHCLAHSHTRQNTSPIGDNRLDNKMESSLEDKQNPITVNYSTLLV